MRKRREVLSGAAHVTSTRLDEIRAANALQRAKGQLSCGTDARAECTTRDGRARIALRVHSARPSSYIRRNPCAYFTCCAGSPALLQPAPVLAPRRGTSAAAAGRGAGRAGEVGGEERRRAAGRRGAEPQTQRRVLWSGGRSGGEQGGRRGSAAWRRAGVERQ